MENDEVLWRDPVLKSLPTSSQWKSIGEGMLFEQFPQQDCPLEEREA